MATVVTCSHSFASTGTHKYAINYYGLIGQENPLPGASFLSPYVSCPFRGLPQTNEDTQGEISVQSGLEEDNLISMGRSLAIFLLSSFVVCCEIVLDTSKARRRAWAAHGTSGGNQFPKQTAIRGDFAVRMPDLSSEDEVCSSLDRDAVVRIQSRHRSCS